VQWVARNHAGAFFEQNLEWAYLRWRPWNDLDLRVGRLGLDVFLLSDYRNVGYAYPWMRPPQEFYAPLFPYHLDGADIAQRFHLGEGFLTLKSSVPQLPTLGSAYLRENENAIGYVDPAHVDKTVRVILLVKTP
jgi:hypothetical protein